ncbi:MAG: phosphoribosyltransferase [Chloroflexi bacterium]|nr:MAG: phosphoribosyltransferase [Chloroflexota bacterium]
MIRPYKDRTEAGKLLAPKLEHYRGHPQAIVLGLACGGVPVGYFVAEALNLPLDVFVVRKLGVPGREEVAMGAIAPNGVRVINREVVRQLAISEESMALAAATEQKELERREALYRGDRLFPDLTDRIVILVDDGIASGASMLAAVRSLKAMRRQRLVTAVPVAAPEACERFAEEVDEMICGMTPADFQSVGRWYHDFTPTRDSDVQFYLQRAAQRLQPAQ